MPCLTLRENTERPVTITEGTNRLVAPGAEAIVAAYREQLAQPINKTHRPRFWDGKAAERIAKVFVELP